MITKVTLPTKVFLCECICYSGFHCIPPSK